MKEPEQPARPKPFDPPYAAPFGLAYGLSVLLYLASLLMPAFYRSGSLA